MNDFHSFISKHECSALDGVIQKTWNELSKCLNLYMRSFYNVYLLYNKKVDAIRHIIIVIIWALHFFIIRYILFIVNVCKNKLKIKIYHIIFPILSSLTATLEIFHCWIFLYMVTHFERWIFQIKSSYLQEKM